MKIEMLKAMKISKEKKNLSLKSSPIDKLNQNIPKRNTEIIMLTVAEKEDSEGEPTMRNS